MSDAHLRALEQATRTAPSDLEAARAYTRALERAGRPRQALAETCRRVRLGDAGAVDEVERATRPERQPGLLAAPREVTTAQFAVGLAERTVAVGDLLLLDLHHTSAELVAIGPDLRSRWSATHHVDRPEGRPVACGPDVVHLEHTALVVRSGEDGREISREELTNVVVMTEEAVSVWGDLVLIAGRMIPPLPADDPPLEEVPEPESQGAVRAFRLEEGRLAPLWSRPGHSPVLAGPSRVAIGIPHSIWLDLSGGIELAWSSDGSTARAFPRVDASQACDLDPSGLILARPEGTRESLLEELALESGESRWACHVPGERLRLVGLTPEHALARIGRFGDGALVAIERASGAIAWRRTWRHADSVAAAAPAEGVVYLGRRLERGRIEVEALDIEAGNTVWTAQALALEREPENPAVRLLPWRGGLAVVVGVEDALHVAFLAP